MTTLRDDVSLTESDDGGGVLLDLRSGTYWQLNPSGFTALRMSLRDADELSIARELTSGSDVDPADAVMDVREILDRFVQHGLVVRG